jgi:hypothetical protein
VAPHLPSGVAASPVIASIAKALGA